MKFNREKLEAVRVTGFRVKPIWLISLIVFVSFVSFPTLYYICLRDTTFQPYTEIPDNHFAVFLEAFNNIGQTRAIAFSDIYSIVRALPDCSTKYELLDRHKEMAQRIQDTVSQNPKVDKLSKHRSTGRRLKSINIATTACGRHFKMQAMTMIKSAVLFSQDADLNVIVFSTNKSSIYLCQDLLELRLAANELGFDFTFELHDKGFPSQQGSNLAGVFPHCASQRLLLPSLLPHIDSLIYLDADTIVLSNLTEMWLHFERNMFSENFVVAMAPNTEWPAQGYYSENSPVPFYGRSGLNSDVYLINLTRAREFRLEQSLHRVLLKYREKVDLADQDVYNVVFHYNPENVFLLNCSYNLHWAHCGRGPRMRCDYDSRPGPNCFCKSATTDGVKIVNGCMNTFFYHGYDFLKELFKRFHQFNLLQDSAQDLIQGLKKHFAALFIPCFYLTADDMYRNAEEYLQKVYS